jgi:stress response protein YsnF
VNKEAVVREEVAVGKEAQERTETVQDTVRRTEVEVEDERTKRGPGGTVPKPGAR